jgi:hypothetical protein
VTALRSSSKPMPPAPAFGAGKDGRVEDIQIHGQIDRHPARFRTVSETPFVSKQCISCDRAGSM